jgi:ABC-type branched-subunit amino acid transport system substrate-binding protein
MRLLAAGIPGARSPRRVAVVAAGIAATALVLSGCSLAGSGTTTSDTIRIGYIAPVTGAYAGFTDGDPYMLNIVRDHFKTGLKIGGKNYKVDIITRDSGSDPTKAGQLATQLITQDKVDLLLATSTPETTNPVIAQCEANAVPCLTTIAPWQAVVFGGGFSTTKPMKWTHHFFYGIEGFGNVEPQTWNQVPTNKKVGVLWPNDSDGAAFRDPKTGYAPFAEKAGYTVVDPGPYEDGTQDFTSIIQKFKQENVQVVAGVPTPPDFVTFWTQAAQQGFHPKVATVAKALFFPATVPSIPNDLGQGLAFTSAWGPTFPYKSSFDGTTAAQWVQKFQASPQTKNLTWSEATPDNEALFELAAKAFTAAKNPHDKSAVNAAFNKINMMTLAGQIDFTGGPFPGVAVVPTAESQWEKTSNGKWRWVVVDKGTVPGLKVDRALQAIK